LNKLVPAIPETKEKLHAHGKRTLRTATSMLFVTDGMRTILKIK
jgi:hypothetical protein